MGMFTRLSDIISANINAILDKAEEPEKILKLIVQEMEETLVELRSVAAVNLAEKKQFTKQIERAEQCVVEWQGKAELAMQNAREDLARAALTNKREWEEKVTHCQSQLAVIDESITKLQDDIGRLQAKIAEARGKQKTLVLKQKSTAVRLQSKAAIQSKNIDDVVERFEQYESKIDRMEAEIEAYEMTAESASLHAQFAELEKDNSIEQELEALKKKVA